MNSAAIAVLFTTVVFQPQTFDEAAKKAEANQRTLVVVVGATWCPACQVLKNQVLPEVARRGGLDNVEYAYVDYDEQTDLARQLMQGSQIPQVIRFSTDGERWTSDRRQGRQSVESLLKFLNGHDK